MPDAHHDDPLSKMGYEPRDVATSALVKWGVGLSVFLGVTIIGMVWLHFAVLPPRADTGPAWPTGAIQPEPNTPIVQANPARDMREFRKAEEEKLNSYGWVDRGKGVAHVPIDRAIDIVLAEGLPTRGPAAAVPPAPEAGDVAPESSGGEETVRP